MMARGSGWRERRLRRGEVVRRHLWFALGLALGLGLEAAAQPASAQDQWWEKRFPGTGRSGAPRQAALDDQDSSQPRQAQQQLNDLRPDRTPLRSHEMIAALEAAIERYQ